MISRATVMIYLLCNISREWSTHLSGAQSNLPAFHCESALPQIDYTKVVQDEAKQVVFTIIAWTVTKPFR